MWLGKQGKRQLAETQAELGTTSMGGAQAAVWTRGELRSLPIYGPGGCCWLPEEGESVLVIRGGPGGEEACIVGAAQGAAAADLAPGELCFSRGSGAVILRKDGSILLRGRVAVEGALTVNGTDWQACRGEEG